MAKKDKSKKRKDIKPKSTVDEVKLAPLEELLELSLVALQQMISESLQQGIEWTLEREIALDDEAVLALDRILKEDKREATFSSEIADNYIKERYMHGDDQVRDVRFLDGGDDDNDHNNYGLIRARKVSVRFKPSKESIADIPKYLMGHVSARINVTTSTHKYSLAFAYYPSDSGVFRKTRDKSKIPKRYNGQSVVFLLPDIQHGSHFVRSSYIDSENPDKSINYKDFAAMAGQDNADRVLELQRQLRETIHKYLR